jgi:hypothetical protein
MEQLIDLGYSSKEQFEALESQLKEFKEKEL